MPNATLRSGRHISQKTKKSRGFSFGRLSQSAQVNNQIQTRHAKISKPSISDLK